MVIDGAAEMDAPTSNNPEEFYNMLQSSFNRGASVASSSSSSSARQAGHPGVAGVSQMYDYGMIPPPPPEYQQQQQWTPQQQQQQPQPYAGSDLDFPPSLATAQRYQPTPSPGMYRVKLWMYTAPLDAKFSK